MGAFITIYASLLTFWGAIAVTAASMRSSHNRTGAAWVLFIVRSRLLRGISGSLIRQIGWIHVGNRQDYCAFALLSGQSRAQKLSAVIEICDQILTALCASKTCPGTVCSP